MESRKKSPKPKRKMTREEMQLAIMKKKECDAKALKIVEQLLEPDVDPNYLIDSLKYINKCHMEDVIEERSISKVCGYVLCHKSVTVNYKQQYHISLREKKVYDISKRKYFCSSGCFGASNYLMEQMLTSPLWLREKEAIPEFRIFSTENSQNSSSFPTCKIGEEVNITDRKSSVHDIELEEEDLVMPVEGSITNFVLETVKKLGIKEADSTELSKDSESSNHKVELKNARETKTTSVNSESVEIDNKISKSKEKEEIGIRKSEAVTEDRNLTKNIKNVMKDSIVEHQTANENKSNLSVSSQVIDDDDDDDIIQQCVYQAEDYKNYPTDDIIEQCVYPFKEMKIDLEDDKIEQNVQSTTDNNDTDDDDTIEQCVYTSEKSELIEVKNTQSNRENESKIELKRTESSYSDDIKVEEISETVSKSEIENISRTQSTCEKKDNATSCDMKRKIEHNEQNSSKTEKTGLAKKKRTKPIKEPVGINLASRVEQSFQEWITEDTINYLFGDASLKQEAIDKIERQHKYTLLCQKLNKLQFEDEQEDAEILEKPKLQPAPHFAVLKEEGEKLDLKVRAFYDGKLSFEQQPQKSNTDEQEVDEKFLPFTESHDPTILRRRIFLEKLDQVLTDLLRTLAGNNEVFARVSLNYTSTSCAAVKALIQTFALSAKNILFKLPEWTLVGLVIIKMLSLSDACLASLLSTQQANLYISMILTAYKLNSDYLNLLVASFNPNINPR